MSIATAGALDVTNASSYELTLTANDGVSTSAPVTVVVEVQPAADAPSVPQLPSGSSSGSMGGLLLMILALLGGVRVLRRQ